MPLEQLIEQIPYGTSRRVKCPKCNGTGLTLSITKEDGVVKWHCYRSSCDMGGTKVLSMSTGEVQELLRARNALQGSTEANREFTIPPYVIQGMASKKAFQMLLNTNSLEAYEQGLFKVAFDPKQDRLMYLVQDKDSKIVGAIGRTLCNGFPKVYNYPDSKKIPFTCGKGNTAVIVEDCASACSIARYKQYTGLALLGTHLSTEYLFYISANYTNIIIALDPDAYSKSFKLKNSINYFVENVLIWQLGKDLKNMTREEIQRFIQ